MHKSGVQEREIRQQIIIVRYSPCYKGTVQEACPRTMEVVHHYLICVGGGGGGEWRVRNRTHTCEA